MKHYKSILTSFSSQSITCCFEKLSMNDRQTYMRIVLGSGCCAPRGCTSFVHRHPWYVSGESSDLSIIDLSRIVVRSHKLHIYIYICRVYWSDVAECLEEIKTLPGQKRIGLDHLADEVTPLVADGLKAILLFGVITDAALKVSKSYPYPAPNICIGIGSLIWKLTAAIKDFHSYWATQNTCVRVIDAL